VDSTARLEIPQAVREIAERLEREGYDTWAVGGAVRDALLGLSRGDWDLATAARPEAVRRLFRPSYPIGIKFGTVGVRGGDGLVYEVTTFRRDIETDGRHAVVEYADEIEDDLARRDFTVNAIAYHPLRHEYRDPHGGRADLSRKNLRCVGEPAQRFAEDYLRVLRGLRFAGLYQLEIQQATWDALIEAVPRLPRLSGERIREELVKTLDGSVPSAALALYRKSGALETIAPELADLADEGWKNSLEAIDSLPESRAALRLVLLFAAAGSRIENLMTRLRFSNAEMREVATLARAMEWPLPGAGDIVTARRWLSEVTPERANDTLRLHFAMVRARTGDAAARRALAESARVVLSVKRSGDPVSLKHLAIDGNEILTALGARPGPEIGRLLRLCLDAVIEDPKLNRREVLMRLVREWS
jgi:tRNA nucleotidyltransferase (CCA-adding enzyme)